MMKTMLAGAAMVALLQGCAAVDARDNFIPGPLHCEGKAQCDAMWSRAQLFVTQKSAYKVQMVSDSIIQTFGPLARDPGLAYLVTRETSSDGNGIITVRPRCANMFGCVPSISRGAQDFVAYVMQAR